MRAILASADRPSAIVAANDFIALGAIDEVTTQGLRVPDDIAVIGFDDIPLVTHVDPPLTTHLTKRVIEVCCEALLSSLNHGVMTMARRQHPGYSSVKAQRMKASSWLTTRL